MNNLFNIPTIGITNASVLFNADRIPVKGSTCIQSIGIDDNGRLEIEFQNDAIYQYDCHGVEPAVMYDILDADSRGQYYCGHVRGQYPSYKIKSGTKGLSRYRPYDGSVDSPYGKHLTWRESFDRKDDVYDDSNMGKFGRLLHRLGLKRNKTPRKVAQEGDWSRNGYLD